MLTQEDMASMISYEHLPAYRIVIHHMSEHVCFSLNV